MNNLLSRLRTRHDDATIARGKKRITILRAVPVVLLGCGIPLTIAATVNYYLNAPNTPAANTTFLGELSQRDFWKRIELDSLVGNLLMGCVAASVFSFLHTYSQAIEHSKK
jgi:hypothetical protein